MSGFPDQYTQTPNAYTVQGWPLPSAGNSTRHMLAQAFETNPGQYLSAENQTKTCSKHLLTTTRAGDYAEFGQPKLAHPRFAEQTGFSAGKAGEATIR
jgi:hypothetical protein